MVLDFPRRWSVCTLTAETEVRYSDIGRASRSGIVPIRAANTPCAMVPLYPNELRRPGDTSISRPRDSRVETWAGMRNADHLDDTIDNR